MDIQRINQDMSFLNQIGCIFSTNEIISLELSLQKLKETQPAEKILFWGKIQTISKPYYIALSLTLQNQYEFVHKTFYWTQFFVTRSTNFLFEELPAMNLEYSDKIQLFRMNLSGDPNKILIQVPQETQEKKKEVEKQQEHDPDQEVEVKPLPKNFLEIDRLAYLVRAIDNDCHVVPVGAFKLIQKHQIRYNENFEGLKKSQAIKIENYQHFRHPQQNQTKKQYGKNQQQVKPETVFRFDIFDPISLDLPKGCWSIHSDQTQLEITVRNLLWMGFIGYHKANTNIFGSCYYGNAIKNVDLPFYQ